MDRRPSILDSIGHEIIGVMSPVSICMLLVVLLVSTTPNGDVNNIISDSPITAATLVYQEASSDSALHKLEGALLNAAAFVALVTAATFLLFLLYYFNFTSFLKNYMRFSAFFVLFSMGGSILFSLLRRFSLPLDAGSSLLLLFNFAAVGVLSVFSPALPILLRQGYMVALGIIVAASFTRLPEWTTWTLLLALAVYDLVAVLAPGGPLRLLVNLASSRDGELPAFVYEARPTTIPRRQQRPTTVGALELMPMVSSRDGDEEDDSPLLLNSSQDSGNASAMGVRNRHPNPHSEGISSSSSSEISIEVESSHVEGTETETAPLVAGRVPSSNPGTNSNRSSGAEMFEASGLEMLETTRGIRLGLGDFVFYSVLVGRAAMYDWMTVYACYLAIIAGLGCTLILLAVWRQALPALPISITLGVMFYFLTRLLMEPFVVGASTSLVMF